MASDNRDLTPRMVVDELDRYIIGQHKAKRAVAIAMRNRWRRQMVEEHMREEISPKNIIMVGPTGVGKTEIARRLARLAGSPFLKVEASKFTEVGYVGRDVESMVRDLVEIGIDMVRQERREQVRAQAGQAVQLRLLDLLLPPRPRPAPSPWRRTSSTPARPWAPSTTTSNPAGGCSSRAGGSTRRGRRCGSCSRPPRSCERAA